MCIRGFNHVCTHACVGQRTTLGFVCKEDPSTLFSNRLSHRPGTQLSGYIVWLAGLPIFQSLTPQCWDTRTHLAFLQGFWRPNSGSQSWSFLVLGNRESPVCVKSWANVRHVKNPTAAEPEGNGNAFLSGLCMNVDSGHRDVHHSLSPTYLWPEDFPYRDGSD